MELTKACNQYGAQMGRRSTHIPDRLTAKLKFRMRKLRWVDEDYDEGGAYWGGGMGDFIYQCEAEGEEEMIDLFVRAYDRDEAKAEVRKTYPRATFYR